MAQQTIDAADSLNAGRTKINANFTEVYGAWADHVPTFTGFSADPAGYTSRKFIVNKLCHYHFVGTGTSNATTLTMTLPAVAKYLQSFLIRITNNNGAYTTGLLLTAAGSNVATLYSSPAAAAWTASSTKGALFTITFEVE